MVQLLHPNGKFTDLPHKDPQILFKNFIEIINTYIPTGVSSDYVRMTLFPYSLLAVAKNWLDMDPQKLHLYLVLPSKEALVSIFPSKKTTRLRSEI